MSRLFRVLTLVLLFASHSVADDFEIGLVICLTGPCAPDGDSTIKGVQLAVDELNAAGGVLGRQVKVVIEDTAEATHGAGAVSAYKNLRLDKSIQYFVGPSWSPGGLALAPLISKDNIIISSPSLGVKEFHESGDNVFNIRGTDEATTRRLAQYAIEKGWKRAAILSSQQAWEQAQGQYFADEFTKLGGTVTIKLEPLADSTNLQTEALQVIKTKPDVIFYSQYVQLAISAKNIRRLNYKGPQLLAAVDETVIKNADGALTGATHGELVQIAPEFIKKFKSRYTTPVELPASTSYDAVMIYAAAIEKAGTFDPSVVKKFIAEIDHAGASGRLKFNEKGGAIRDPNLSVVQ